MLYNTSLVYIVLCKCTACYINFDLFRWWRKPYLPPPVYCHGKAIALARLAYGQPWRVRAEEEACRTDCRWFPYWYQVQVQPPKRRRANTIGDRIPSPESCNKENTNPVMVISIFSSHLSYCLTHRGLLRRSLSHAGWHQKDISPRLLLYPSLILQHHLGMPRCSLQLLHMQKSLHDDRINHRQALQSAGKPCRTSGKSCFLTVSVAVPSSNSKAIECFIVAFS